MVPLPLYGTGIVWSPTCMYAPPPHVKCLHVLYDSYGPHTLYGIGIIWSPTCTYGPPHVLYDSYGPPLPYMAQVSYGPTTCLYGSPHM